MSKILIIEDDKNTVKALKELLGEHTIYWSENGQDAIKEMKKQKIDLVILDLMLPQLNGIELLKQKIFDEIPVIAVTAKNEIESEVKCYELGIRNYIRKPFEPRVLKTIIENILNPIRETKIKYRNIEVDLLKKTVSKDRKNIELTPKEYNLLVFLLQNIDIALFRQEILDYVWGIDEEIETRTVDVHIQKLRKKLNLEKEIISISKVGYRLEK